MHASLVLTVALLALSQVLHAEQVRARQGAVDKSRRFTSPMILEAPLPVLPGFKRTLFGRELAEFTCDDVSLRELSYQVTGNRKDPDRPTEIDVAGWLWVPSSFDREVDVALTVKNGDETLGTNTKLRISAEEGRRSFFRLKVPIIRLRGITGSSLPVVEITMTVRDNS